MKKKKFKQRLVVQVDAALPKCEFENFERLVLAALRAGTEHFQHGPVTALVAARITLEEVQ